MFFVFEYGYTPKVDEGRDKTHIMRWVLHAGVSSFSRVNKGRDKTPRAEST